jgi:hypothetical protein
VRVYFFGVWDLRIEVSLGIETWDLGSRERWHFIKALLRLADVAYFNL